MQDATLPPECETPGLAPGVDEKALHLSIPQRLVVIASVDALLIMGERGHEIHWVVLDTS
jgi:hypothetical protein